MPKDEQAQGRTRSGDKGSVYHCANRMLWRVEIFSIREKFSMDLCPNPVYFNTPLLIIY